MARTTKAAALANKIAAEAQAAKDAAEAQAAKDAAEAQAAKDAAEAQAAKDAAEAQAAKDAAEAQAAEKAFRWEIERLKDEVNASKLAAAQAAEDAVAVQAVKPAAAQAAKLAAARAEFNARRAAAPTVADTRAESDAFKAGDVSPLKATVVDEPTEPKADAWANLKIALEAVQTQYGVCSWKRYVCSLLVSLAASFATGYVGGLVINSVLSMTFIATSAFMSWAVLIIGVLLSIAAGVFVGRKAFHYIASEHIDLHYEVVKGAVCGVGSWIGGLFTSNEAKADRA